ncbi:hypothetical protein BGZ80_002070 [Entomortierella chlamydospora]|uniref:Uncharacterized protein n=1 Tax=Entomortierella chlamydospora TaxID=101097 RepID=A0A9P6T4R8_9FUNG|nr:hypothetical protein BGZ80_002070 [Entomortierella chlamydospora]
MAVMNVRRDRQFSSRRDVELLQQLVDEIHVPTRNGIITGGAKSKSAKRFDSLPGITTPNGEDIENESLYGPSRRMKHSTFNKVI